MTTAFNKPLPRGPQPPEEVYEEFFEQILPYPVGNIHPRFWGWVFGTGTAFVTVSAGIVVATLAFWLRSPERGPPRASGGQPAGR